MNPVGDRETKYWVIVASKDHVKKGMAEGFAQACHGSRSPLQRMKKGDYVIYYSGKESFTKSKKCQKFTALGMVKGDDVYPFQMNETFCPFRRDVLFYDIEEVPILPLIDKLSFIKDVNHWGYPFRYGFFEIDRQDFDLISKRMLIEQLCREK